MPTGKSNDEQNSAMLLAAYNQNWETFRSLNSLMWQIPLIAMTLTGGLWFGVSTVKDMPLFAAGLLLLAGCGNIGLALTLRRLRYIMAQYLKWSKAIFPQGHIDAQGEGCFTGNETVRAVFQALLILAAIISFVLLTVTMTTTNTPPARSKAVAYYDRHAVELADSYEGISFDSTHPALVEMLADKPPMRVLDIGAGTGRDAAAITRLGHFVTAVDPSTKMLKLAQTLHPDDRISWTSDALPGLAKIQGPKFDVVLLSAVWMHIPPAERAKAFQRISTLINPTGKIYISLRIGPRDHTRGIWPVDSQEIRALATGQGLKVNFLGTQPDLLGRANVSWQILIIGR